MNIEHLKYLFTPGKPEKDGKYLALSSLGGIEYIHYTAIIGWNTHDFIVITHFLDLSKLTTKEQAHKWIEYSYLQATKRQVSDFIITDSLPDVIRKATNGTENIDKL